MTNEFGDPFGRRQAERLASFDRRIAGIRRWYFDSLDLQERDLFRKWIERAAMVSNDHPFDAESFWCEIEVSVVANFEDSQTGKWLHDTIRVDPVLLADAIQKWDEGAEYTPSYVIKSGE